MAYTLGKKKMLRRISKIIAIVLILLGVAAFLLRDSRLAAQIRFAGNAHVPSVDADFGNLQKVLPSKSATIVEAFLGLPHNFADTDDFIQELWHSDNRSIHGYRFYSDPIALTDELKQVIHGLFTVQGAFTPYGGPKLCGGYHADFAVRCYDAGQQYWFLVCLGCHEVLCFTKGEELIIELESNAHKGLVAAWKKNKEAQQAVHGNTH
jgi:hypothetical protein